MDKKVSVFVSHPDINRVRLAEVSARRVLFFVKITISHLFVCSDSSLYAAATSATFREDVQRMNHAQSLPDIMRDSRPADIYDKAASG